MKSKTKLKNTPDKMASDVRKRTYSERYLRYGSIWWYLGVILAFGCVCAVSPPSIATASGVRHSGPHLKERNVEGVPYGRFLAHGTHGFKILVSGTPSSVRLIVFRGHAATQYLDTAGRATSSTISANFGRRGRVDVRFEPGDRYATRPLPGQLGKCRSLGRHTERFGIFSGRIEFRGEHDFTKVKLRRAHGRAGPRRPLRCSAAVRSESKSPGEGSASHVEALWSLGSFNAGAQAFSGIDLGGSLLPLGLSKLRHRGVAFSAELREEEGSLLIRRVAVAKGDAGTLIIDKDQQVAKIQPPAPFNGSAVVSNCSRPEWDGNLSVNFPGKTVTLTSARLRHSAVLYPARRCAR